MGNNHSHSKQKHGTSPLALMLRGEVQSAESLPEGEKETIEQSVPPMIEAQLSPFTPSCASGGRPRACYPHGHARHPPNDSPLPGCLQEAKVRTEGRSRSYPPISISTWAREPSLSQQIGRLQWVSRWPGCISR